MNIDKETQEQIQELQTNEQIFQQLLMQKQAFQLESNETENSLVELAKSKGDVFKIIGQIIFKAEKKELEEELKKKQKLISLRLESIEKQLASLETSTEELRNEIMKKINEMQK